jgi:hypothetical protein
VSLVPNINRSLIENLEITIPLIEQQTNVIKMHQDFIRETQLLQALIQNREQQVKAIAQDILKIGK